MQQFQQLHGNSEGFYVPTNYFDVPTPQQVQTVEVPIPYSHQLYGKEYQPRAVSSDASKLAELKKNYEAQGRAFKKSHEELETRNSQMKRTLDEMEEKNAELVLARARIAALVLQAAKRDDSDASLQLQQQSKDRSDAEEKLETVPTHDKAQHKSSQLKPTAGTSGYTAGTGTGSNSRLARPSTLNDTGTFKLQPGILATVGYRPDSSPWLASFKRAQPGEDGFPPPLGSQHWHEDPASLSACAGEGSVGIVLKQIDCESVVVQVLAGGSAAESNSIGVGDVIEAVGDRRARELSVSELIALISGPVGTEVSLSLDRVTRHGGSSKAVVQLTRRAPATPRSQRQRRASVESEGSALALAQEQSEAQAAREEQAWEHEQAAAVDVGGYERELSAAHERVQELEKELSRRDLESKLWAPDSDRQTPRSPFPRPRHPTFAQDSQREADDASGMSDHTSQPSAMSAREPGERLRKSMQGPGTATLATLELQKQAAWLGAELERAQEEVTQLHAALGEARTLNQELSGSLEQVMRRAKHESDSSHQTSAEREEQLEASLLDRRRLEHHSQQERLELALITSELSETQSRLLEEARRAETLSATVVALERHLHGGQLAVRALEEETATRAARERGTAAALEEERRRREELELAAEQMRAKVNQLHVDCAEKVREVQELRAKEEQARKEVLLAWQKSEQDQQQVMRLEERVAFSDARFHEAAARSSSLQKEVCKAAEHLLVLRGAGNSNEKQSPAQTTDQLLLALAQELEGKAPPPLPSRSKRKKAKPRTLNGARAPLPLEHRDGGRESDAGGKQEGVVVQQLRRTVEELTARLENAEDAMALVWASTEAGKGETGRPEQPTVGIQGGKGGSEGVGGVRRGERGGPGGHSGWSLPEQGRGSEGGGRGGRELETRQAVNLNALPVPRAQRGEGGGAGGETWMSPERLGLGPGEAWEGEGRQGRSRGGASEFEFDEGFTPRDALMPPQVIFRGPGQWTQSRKAVPEEASGGWGQGQAEEEGRWAGGGAGDSEAEDHDRRGMVLGQFMDLMEAKELIPTLLSEDEAIDAFDQALETQRHEQGFSEVDADGEPLLLFRYFKRLVRSVTQVDDLEEEPRSGSDPADRDTLHPPPPPPPPQYHAHHDEYHDPPRWHHVMEHDRMEGDRPRVRHG